MKPAIIMIIGIVLAVIAYSATTEMWITVGIVVFFLIIGAIIYAFIEPQKDKFGRYND
jgi:hypothetical protein